MTVARAAVVAVGDELLSGSVVESNGPRIARATADLGLRIEEIRVARDDPARLAEDLADLARRYRLVFVTGGLGPTLDDITREALARAAGVELELDAEGLVEVESWWRSRDLPMPDMNRRQAMLPAGAVRVRNRAGTAPGFRMELGDATFVVLPGPPRELSVMLESEVLPWLEERHGRAPVARAELHLHDLSESVFAERVGEWMDRAANPEIGVTASRGVLTVRMRALGATVDEARAILAPRLEAFRERFVEHVFSEVDAAPEAALARELLGRGLTITFAESCTGGLVAGMLTAVPGASGAFADGFVTYSNDAKTRRLGVAPELLEAHGAVSSEVAAAMAQGAVQMTGADVGLSITGIAGPDGGSPEKPVGLVWFGLRAAGRTQTLERRFPARASETGARGREWVRDYAARTALLFAWRNLPGGRPRWERPEPASSR